MATLCSLCRSLCPTPKLYVSHLRVVHSRDPSFNVLCGIGGCREVFRTFSAFNSHIYRHHRCEMGISEADTSALLVPQTVDMTEVTVSDVAIEKVDEQDTDFYSEEVVELLSTSVANSGTPSSSRCTVEFEGTVMAAKMLLKLREGHQISQAALSEVMSSCRFLCNQAVDNLKHDFARALSSPGPEREDVSLLLTKDYDPFQNIDTVYRFEKFCIDHLGCLEAKEITFGEPYVDQFAANVHRKVSRTDKFYHVPLCSTLQKLMELDDYQAEVLNPHTSTSSGVLGDFCDGTLYQSHPLFSIDPYALQIIGYYDEVEVVNPLGAYIKKHKLGCLFFFLGNIRPQYRSTLKSIQLVAVGLSNDIQKYGINAFLAPFVDDLKKLYCDGIVVSVGGECRTFHGALLAFLADTLAAHTVGGFKGSMSFALRVCRTCMATPEQLQACSVESSCTLRTPHSYSEHCRLLSGPLKAHYSTTYGINYMSILEEVPGYSVIQGLPHDIMHDLYEGIVPHEMKLLMCYCIGEKYFTVAELNERIERFGFIDNKPRLLDTTLSTSDTKIRQSASQMMVLCQALPLLIADRIPLDDPNWNSFLLLLRICSVANSPVCTPDTIAYLKIVIEEKLKTFKALYSNEKLLPKHHYMVHYPSQMERLGPLIQSWTMRQEAKLSFVKRVSRQSNYKNVCKTVVKKHQFWMCYQLLNQHVLTPSTTSSPRFKTITLQNEDECVRAEFIRLIPSISMDSEIHHLEWFKVQSSVLQNGTFVMLEYSIDTPTFGLVVDVLRFEETVLLYVQKYIGEFLNSHYNAFVVKSHGEFIVVNLWSLCDYRPVTVKYNFVPSDHQLYAILPYYY